MFAQNPPPPAVTDAYASVSAPLSGRVWPGQPAIHSAALGRWLIDALNGGNK
ncbi:hypothetical protein HYPSUDRAFT_67325 [Hypholoma sublateritium FD-334 SS-4]|uniref:Uncharacterized protein n=1 Tax=Hypholoma sublateritium (strain FD-334 SS-4) TaxID=945553 RepID=A0A0D2NT08_HYPSF|nr:hypothetical protein HYPSUDRAFT_67325 [Hypholoma sublateritium FD-334 SS-4]